MGSAGVPRRDARGVKRCAVETANPDSARHPYQSEVEMYRKPKNPNKRRAVRAARLAMLPAMDRAMTACRIARDVGLMVLSVHAINGSPVITP